MMLESEQMDIFWLMAQRFGGPGGRRLLMVGTQYKREVVYLLEGL